MENLIFSFNVVLPLFLLMCLGTFLKKINIFDEVFLKTGNKFAFKILLPTLLFYNIYESDISNSFTGRLVLFAVIIVLGLLAMLLIIVPKYEKDNNNRGVLIQGLIRSNFVLFGIPLCTNIFGEMGKGVASMLIAVIVPMYNFICVAILDLYSKEKIDIKGMAVGILKNPMIVASLIAIFISLLHIKLPAAIEKTVSDVGKIATPFALMLLGGEFQIDNVHKNRKYLIIVSIGKLILIPAFIIPIAILFGFRGVELGALFAMAASPVAVSSYVMAAQCNSNDELAGQIVFVTTLLSSVTIFAFTYILKTLSIF